LAPSWHDRFQPQVNLGPTPLAALKELHTEQAQRRLALGRATTPTLTGGALLVPEPAAVRIARQRIPLGLAAGAYGVSEQLMRWRLQVTGAAKRAERTAQRIA